jgi:hypothetical protein
MSHFALDFLRLLAFFLSMADFGTARNPRVKLVRRSIGVSPDILTFIGVSFCRTEVAAWKG